MAFTRSGVRSPSAPPTKKSKKIKSFVPESHYGVTRSLDRRIHLVSIPADKTPVLLAFSAVCANARPLAGEVAEGRRACRSYWVATFPSPEKKSRASHVS